MRHEEGCSGLWRLGRPQSGSEPLSGPFRRDRVDENTGGPFGAQQVGRVRDHFEVPMILLPSELGQGGRVEHQREGWILQHLAESFRRAAYSDNQE